MNRAIVLALLVAAAAAAPDGGWSWGAEHGDKKEPDQPVKVEQPVQEEGRSFQVQFPIQTANVVEIPIQDFVQPLPLEPHSVSSSSFEGSQAQAALYVVNESAESSDPNRKARFLGISDTLCEWGVGISCNNNKIKKKGHGYRPSINTQYGVPSGQYNAYESHHGQSSYSTNVNNYQHKPKGHKKKGGNGVSDLISGFLNSYTKPKADKGYAAPSQLPTYLPPSHGTPIYVAKPIISPVHYTPLQPNYAAPQNSYVAPKATYAAPRPTYAVPKPAYAVPKPAYNPPKASYGAPKPSHHLSHKTSFVDSSYSAQVVTHQKPKYVHTPARVTTVYTHTVAPVEATKVQHLHSHTHVYHGAHVIKPGNSGYSISNGHLQKKSDFDSSVLHSVGASTDSFGDESSSFVSGGFGSATAGSSNHGFINNPVEASTTNLNHNRNPFDSVPTQQTFGNGNQDFSSHTQFISHNSQSHSNGFLNSFQPPSQSEFGFKPSLTIEDMINNNHLISQYSRTIYRNDCHCVSKQFCSAENIVNGVRDFSDVIDARNRKSEVYSNSTSEEDYTTENVTEAESSRQGKSFDFSEVFGVEDAITTDSPDYEYEDKEYLDAENSTTVAPEVVRKRRDTDEASSDVAFSDTQGRQLTGYTPGSKGCGSGTVCCRRPIYSPARALPVCGISNDENIHGRIKTKSHDSGRAGFAEYPWQAAILRRSGGEMVYVCGASLISDQYLVTAAHCVKDIETSSLKIRVGEWDVRDKTEFYPHVEADVSGLYIHPEFYEGNLENDIAIIRVSQRIDYSKYPHILPVCLPSQGSDFTGKVCTITGWGKDGWGSEGQFQAILKETKVPVMNTDVCEQVLRTTKLGPNYNLHKGMICAGGEENKDACKGDGGGPLVCRGSAGEYHLAGIVSWGIGCGERGIPGVYVDVPHYIDWINSIARS